ncbi:gastrin/cholecystokinin-like peptide [Cynoglossus semilaevis]|uniref:gastrin/cholecystokinin-like peptide n=1 Tax=Cynoglossus semilaevis TaxID=244447 RepID=UPI000D6311BD|nr:gastrin/cholecystokinin-like peptide [Cynoglossus semilaevis]
MYLDSLLAGEVKKTKAIQRLLAEREKMRDGDYNQEPVHQTRTQRHAYPSEDKQDIMTKQIIQAISEIMNSECMPDRDYQGWVDFGRRDAE